MFKNPWYYHADCCFQHYEVLKCVDPAKEIHNFGSLVAPDQARILALHRAVETRFPAETQAARARHTWDERPEDPRWGYTDAKEFEIQESNEEKSSPKKAMDAKKKSTTSKKVVARKAQPKKRAPVAKKPTPEAKRAAPKQKRQKSSVVKKKAPTSKKSTPKKKAVVPKKRVAVTKKKKNSK